jgi:hypothetical protein
MRRFGPLLGLLVLCAALGTLSDEERIMQLATGGAQ